jgi:hypothetical protein
MSFSAKTSNSAIPQRASFFGMPENSLGSFRRVNYHSLNSGCRGDDRLEAMIIDSPKRAQRILRHTEKRSSLRSASSPMTRSEEMTDKGRVSGPPNPAGQSGDGDPIFPWDCSIVYNPTPGKDALDVMHLDASLMKEKSLRDRIHGAHEVKASTSMEQYPAMATQYSHGTAPLRYLL